MRAEIAAFLTLRCEEVIMKHLSFIVPTLLLAGCASTSPPPGSFPRDPWNAVTAIERGADVVIHVQCREDGADPCPPEGAEATVAGYRLEGRLAEASAASILVGPSSPGTKPTLVARANVTRVFVEKSSSKRKGLLVGTAVGLTVCALACVYCEPDHGPLLFSGTALLTYICAGGGATLGYLVDRDAPTLVLIYDGRCCCDRWPAGSANEVTRARPLKAPLAAAASARALLLRRCETRDLR
jgi:hypothetical protein